MGTHLHQTLRNLCLDSDWKYAVFWKLKHRARMMLTWENAYYDSHDKHDPPENMCFTEIGGNLSDRHSHDPLGLAVAQMSYRVYSLGEGVIGQVAVTGKHMWIFADKHVTDSYLPFGHYDGWQTQFSAGIKTVVLVAVVPLGVVQLGSLTRIPEDLKLVNRIRDGFFALSVGFTPSATHCTLRSSSSLSDVSTRSSVSGNPCDCISNSGRPVNKDKIIIPSPTVSSTENPADCSYVLPLPGDLAKNTVEVISMEGGLDFSTSRVANSLQSRSDTFLSGQQKQILTRLHIDRKCGGETSCFGFGYLGVGSEDHHALSSDNSFGKVNLGNITFPADDSRVDLTSFPSDLLNSAACNYNDGISCTPEPFDMQIPNELGNMNFQTEINNTEALNAPLIFAAGCELYEVLGPAFRKHGSFCEWEAERTLNERDNTEMQEGKDNSSLLTADSGSEHLLEAVVANVCRSGTDFEGEKSFSKPLKSVLITEKKPQPPNDKVTVGSVGYSFNQSLVEKDTLHSLNSEVSGVSSSKGVSSRSRSTFSEQLDSMQERGKMNKKRARPGENGRPRPRDRQLIQDRIKELRELVPNGGKCSIDSLLERTIKHMLFMQSVTKHADKLNKCTDSKLRDKETIALGLPNYDQGSSWATEVESHLKVCPIIVENINMNGQLLIEMLCEECRHFLEIAKVIRSLGLTILKGVTEARDKKIWMCFVVEGQNDRSLHRMDILWSLVQILQSNEI